MKLIDILNQRQYRTDKHTVHRYIQEFYESEFDKYRDKPIRLLEIGVLNGESLKLWRDYFKKGEIIGIDIFHRVNIESVKSNLKEYDVRLEVVDSFNKGEAAKSRDNFIAKNKTLGFDIIIDDGLHSEYAQFHTFSNFSSLINPGGIFVIEDIRDSSIKKLSEIRGLEILHLNEGPQSRVTKQAIGIKRF